MIWSHIHSYPFTRSKHDIPFKQGLLEHSLMSTRKKNVSCQFIAWAYSYICIHYPDQQGLLSHSLMCARRKKKDTSLISTNPDGLCQNKFKENPLGLYLKISWSQQAEQHYREVTYAPVWQRFPPYPGRQLQSGCPRASATHVPPFKQGSLAMEHTLISTKNVLYQFLVLPKYSEHFNGVKWTSVCSFQHRMTLLKICN